LNNGAHTENWEFELYIAGDTFKSRNVVENLRMICNRHLNGHCHVRVVDLRKNPEMAAEKNIWSLPMLVKTGPGPEKILIGDLSRMENVLIGLELKSRPMKSEPVYRSPVKYNRL